MDKSFIQVNTIQPKPLKPSEVLKRPVWRTFWERFFPEPKYFMCTDRCTFERFIYLVEVYITQEESWATSPQGKEGKKFSFSVEEKAKLSSIIDPWNSCLVSVQQLCYLEEYFDRACADDSLYTLMKDLLTFEPMTIPRSMIKSDPSIDADTTEIQNQILEYLKPTPRPLVCVIYGERGMGKTTLARQIIRHRIEEAEPSVKSMVFYCDARACYSPSALLCQLSRAVRFPLLGDQDPHAFFTWVRRFALQRVLFVIDNLDRLPSAVTSLASVLTSFFEITRNMKFLVLATASDVKDGLMSCGLSTRKIVEVALPGIQPEKAIQVIKDYPGVSPTLADSLALPNNSGYLSLILHCVARGYVTIESDKKYTFDDILQVILDKPLRHNVALPWKPESVSARMILDLLYLFRDFFDLKGVSAILSSTTATEIKEDEILAVFEELIELDLIEETTGLAYGKKYSVTKFVRKSLKSRSSLSQAIKDTLREHFCKYHCLELAAAGEALVYGNDSAAFQFFDEHRSDLTTMLVGKMSPTCFYEYYTVARHASKILKSRLTASDQVQFYSRLIDLMKLDPERFENGLVSPYVKTMLASAYLALDDDMEAKSLSKQAVALIKGVIGNRPAEDNDSLKVVLSIALEYEARAFTSHMVMEQAADMRSESLGRHPETCDAFYQFGVMLESGQRSEEALDIFKSTLDMMQKIIPNHPLTGYALSRAGVISRQYRRNYEALNFLRESLVVLEESVGKGHPKVGMCHYWIARCLMDSIDAKDLSKLKEAEQQALLGLKTLADCHEPGHYETTNAFELWDNITRQMSVFVPGCQICQAAFTILQRRHRCRACGAVICADCSPSRANRTVPEMGCFKPVRVCSKCAFDS